MHDVAGSERSLAERLMTSSGEFVDLHMEREVLEAVLGPVVSSWPPGWAGLGKHPLTSLDDAFDLMDDAFPDWVFRAMGNFSCPVSSLFTATFVSACSNTVTGEGKAKHAAILAAALLIREKHPLDSGCHHVRCERGPFLFFDDRD